MGIIATILAIFWLWFTVHLYVADWGNPTISHSCGGGLGLIGPGLEDVSGVFCVWPLAGGLVASSLLRALRRRQWAWVGGLTAAAIAGIVGTIGSLSAVSHQAVTAVLGMSCGRYTSAVTVYAAILLVAVAGLAYTLRHRPRA